MRKWYLPALAMFVIGSCRLAFAAPVAEFDKIVFDFGKITTGDKGKAVFLIKNSGDQPLAVTKIFAICACTKVVKSSIPNIAPGKSDRIEVAFGSVGLQGKIMKRILVKSNDPAHEKTLLTIKADVLPLATLNPGSINIGTLEPNGKYDSTVILTPATSKPFKILKVIPGTNSSVAKYVPAKDGKGSYKLSVVVKAGASASRVMDELKIVTDLPGQPSITLLVYGNVAKEVSPDAAGS